MPDTTPAAHPTDDAELLDAVKRMADAYAEADLLGQAVDQYRAIVRDARYALTLAERELAAYEEVPGAHPMKSGCLVHVRHVIAAIDALGSP